MCYNSKVFGAELLQILCSGLGATLIIPITVLITALMLKKRQSPKKEDTAVL